MNVGRHYSKPAKPRCAHCGQPAEGPTRVGAALLCTGVRGCWALVTVEAHPATALRDEPCDRCTEDAAGDA